MFENLFCQSGLSLDRLRNFLMVAEAGSIVKAAQADVVRQSLYSRQIRELETFFGAQLTERRGKGIAISPAGRRLALLIRENLQSLEDFQREQAHEVKEFTLGAGSSVLEWVVLPCMRDVAAHLSGATIRVQTLKSLLLVEAVREGKIDFAVVREDALPSGLPRVALGKVSFWLCVGRDLKKKHKAASHLRADIWSKLPLALSMTGGHFHEALKQECASRGLALRPTVECQSFLQVRQLIALGGYAGILPSLGLAGLEATGAALHAFAPLKDYGRTLCLHWNTRQMQRRGLEQREVNAIATTLKRSFKASFNDNQFRP